MSFEMALNFSHKVSFKVIGPLLGPYECIIMDQSIFLITRTVIELLHVYVRNKTEPFLFTFG